MTEDHVRSLPTEQLGLLSRQVGDEIHARSQGDEAANAGNIDRASTAAPLANPTLQELMERLVQICTNFQQSTVGMMELAMSVVSNTLDLTFQSADNASVNLLMMINSVMPPNARPHSSDILETAVHAVTQLSSQAVAIGERIAASNNRISELAVRLVHKTANKGSANLTALLAANEDEEASNAN